MPTYTNQSRNNATATRQTRNSAVATNEVRTSSDAIYTVIGMATGLIAPPTYATELQIQSGSELTFTNQSRS